MSCLRVLRPNPAKSDAAGYRRVGARVFIQVRITGVKHDLLLLKHTRFVQGHRFRLAFCVRLHVCVGVSVHLTALKWIQADSPSKKQVGQDTWLRHAHLHGTQLSLASQLTQDWTRDFRLAPEAGRAEDRWLRGSQWR